MIPFDNDRAARLRKLPPSRPVLIGLWTRAAMDGDQDWLDWAKTDAAERFPTDPTLMALQIIEAIKSDDRVRTTTLSSILRSLPADKRDVPQIWDGLIAATYAVGKQAQASSLRAELGARHPEYEPIWPSVVPIQTD